MQDESARLAARLARQEGKTHPLDWVRLWESHTPYEWAVQIALADVEPWGDERADIREARNTAHVIAASRPYEIPEDEFRGLVIDLARYLKCDAPPEPTVGPRAIRQALGDA